MKWKDLTMASRCVLERCWGLHTNDPQTYSIPLGKTLFKHRVTLDTFTEIIKYQKHFPYFNAKLEEEMIIVSGIGQYGSWDI
ncbi:hypothetical protein ANABIO32_00550 [Rossellomorea marisflavi]|uniref:hypothetical protein n=1 Tax=Rossellomorea marisflavi TaxID=189381 RepID=UPI0025CA5E98|nr:hypothetical protein [Rossellomorea marisflavi]GLI82369.1 hypothetical protein ANABIO32_00550 [Rossellomorea marisflavi]